MANSSVDPKTIGILAYISPIGWLIAYVLNSGNRTDYGSFHVRQMLGLIIMSMALRLVAKLVFFGGMVSLVGTGAVFAFWVIGLVGAIQGEERVVPIIGDSFQEWFKTV